MLANGQHRVQKVLTDTPAAKAEVIKAGDTLVQIDDMLLKDTQTDTVAALLAGPPGTGVEMELIELAGEMAEIDF